MARGVFPTKENHTRGGGKLCCVVSFNYDEFLHLSVHVWLHCVLLVEEVPLRSSKTIQEELSSLWQ